MPTFAPAPKHPASTCCASHAQRRAHTFLAAKLQRHGRFLLDPARLYLRHIPGANRGLRQLDSCLAGGAGHVNHGHRYSDPGRTGSRDPAHHRFGPHRALGAACSDYYHSRAGRVLPKEEHKQEAQIMENLRALEAAKARWVAQTKVTDGAYTTVAGLAAYLDGKEIKPVVGETYDPRPIGQKPIATLPATKSLAGHGKGGVLTAQDWTANKVDGLPSQTRDHCSREKAESERHKVAALWRPLQA